MDLLVTVGLPVLGAVPPDGHARCQELAATAHNLSTHVVDIAEVNAQRMPVARILAAYVALVSGIDMLILNSLS